MRKILLILIPIIILSFILENSNADTIYLKINNESLTSQRSDGLWGEIILTQVNNNRVDFKVDPYEDAFSSIGPNFGIQTFGFNKNTSASINISLPTGWDIQYNKQLDGYGDFMLMVNTTGEYRKNPLEFSITSSDQIYISNFIIYNSNGYLFAVHIADFTISGSDKTSAWFSVPEPGILILLGLGLTVVGIGSRYLRKLGKE
jgi:hypothetical protein